MGEREAKEGLVAAGVHLPYARVPARLRHWVESVAGAATVAATDLTGGFSPGARALLILSSGRRPS
jgi:hypothetical protein